MSSNIYIFKCAGETIHHNLRLTKIAKGDVCYSYISNGNYEVTVKNAKRLENSPSFNFDSEQIAQRLRLSLIMSMVCNTLLTAFVVMILTSFHAKR